MRSTPEVPAETTIIENATLVIGDGTSPIRDGAIVMAGGIITDVLDESLGWDHRSDATTIDADGDIVMPGVINAHAHSLLNTPMSASGTTLPGRAGAKQHRDRHLVDGCTTVVNVDSFSLPSELAVANANHPLKIELGACPTPANVRAAHQIDGESLTPDHEHLNIPNVIEAGAVLLGEVGGATLVGGVQRYKYVPDAIEEQTGKRVTPLQASSLIDSVIGKYADPEVFDDQKARDALSEVGLSNDLSPEDLREIIIKWTWASVETALDGFDEVAEYATAYGVPMMIHTAPPSKQKALELAEENVPLIAGHTNYPTFNHEEVLAFASQLKERGVIIEACSWDLFAETNGVGGDKEVMKAMLFEMVSNGYVDYISTDFADATYHSTLVTVDELVANDITTIGEAIALVTGNVASAIPGLERTRGTLIPGKAADVIITDSDRVSEINTVFIDGREVLDSGELVY